jgi:hypothetical protein
MANIINGINCDSGGQQLLPPGYKLVTGSRSIADVNADANCIPILMYISLSASKATFTGAAYYNGGTIGTFKLANNGDYTYTTISVCPISKTMTKGSVSLSHGSPFMSGTVTMWAEKS